MDATVRDPVSCIPSWLRRHVASQTHFATRRHGRVPQHVGLDGLSSSAHTVGAGLQRRHPPVMAVVHRVRLLEPELDQVDAVLRFLGGYPGLATFGDQHSDVVNAEPRVLDTPAESHTLREGPTAVDPHVGRVEHRFGGWVAPIRFIQTTSVGASIDCLISMVGAQGLEPWTR
jgi:hypothetical protein